MSLVDYTDLQKDIDGAQEPKTIKAGTEVKLRIISVRTGVSDKNDCPWFSPVFDVPDEPMAKEFNDFMWELKPDKLDAKQYARAMYQFKTFAAAFDLDLSRPFDLEDDLIGKEGWAIVGSKTDETYGEQNNIKKYVARR